MNRNGATRTRARGGRQSLFERFVERTQLKVSRAPFFAFCVATVLVWAVSFPLWADLKAWQTAIHTVASVFTLLLLALLENAGRRSDETAQEKLNVLATALAALMEHQSDLTENGDLARAARTLREANGLEERH